ncbi:hypothetical protein BHE74_00029639 [Ensete ventricosum]|nr:hypothetical protein BHE74_00029639 [Ensete ventricosum]
MVSFLYLWVQLQIMRFSLRPTRAILSDLEDSLRSLCPRESLTSLALQQSSSALILIIRRYTLSGDKLFYIVRQYLMLRATSYFNSASVPNVTRQCVLANVTRQSLTPADKPLAAKLMFLGVRQ